MNHEALGNRRRALEESFFARQNNELLEQLRADKVAAEQLQQLAAVSGIDDAATLQQLVDADIQPETFAAVSLIPIVQVAWSDGSLDEKERGAVLTAATEQGLTESSAANQLLQDWLVNRPGPDLLEAWKDYIRALSETLEASTLDNLKTQIISRAQSVAEASGGILGLGKIAASEQAVLDDLNTAFSSNG